MTTKAAENPMITVEGFKLKKQSIVSTFSDTAKIDKAVEKFKEEALSVVPDLSTKKGRDAIASMAFKVSKKKTSIVSQMIDPSIEDAKALVKSVNSGKKHFQAEMDKLRDEVRDPLNKWEAEEKLKEEKRIADIQEKIAGISSIVVFDPNNPPSKDEITSLIEAVDAIDCSEGFDEFTQDAIQAQNKAKEVLSEALNDLIKKELQEKAEEEMRLKEAELEEQRLKNLAQERLNKLMMIPVSLIGKSSADIKKKIDSLSNYEVPEAEFGDLYEMAKNSAINVISQLKVMLEQQELVEANQPKAEVDQNEFPQDPRELVQGVITSASQSLPTEEEQTIQLAPKAEEGETITKTVGGFTTQKELTRHEQMIKQVRFWANQYGVVNSELSDLMNILNQYK